MTDQLNSPTSVSALASTPGPWSVGPPHVVAHRFEDERGRRVTRFVAEAVLAAPFREGEREANARLIAAAPAMYEALEEIKELADSAPSSTEVQMIWEAANDALAKAEGRS